MKRAKLLGMCIGLTNTKALTSTRQLGLNSLTLLTQVNRFSVLTKPPSLLSSPINPNNNYYNYNFDLHQKVLFSSKIESFADLVLSNDWSEEIEVELDKLVPKMTHECLVYGLMKLQGNPKKCMDFFKWACVRKGFDPSYVPYRLLLRSLACKEFVNDFWVIAFEMEQRGFYIEKSLHLNVLSDLKRENLEKAGVDWAKYYKTLSDVYNGDEVAKFVVKLLLESEWGKEVEGKLKKKLKFPLSESLVLRVLREVSKQPMRALKFFEWVGSCGGYEHDSVTYNAMIKVLARHESVDEFWEMVEKMKSEGFEIDYDSLIKILRLVPVVDAVKVFEFMMDDGTYKPSLPECYIVLRCISEEPDSDLELANRVVRKCVASGNTLSKKIYDRMHRMLCQIGKFDEAKKIVEEMKAAGFEPDNVTYSQEVYGLCRQKRFEEASKLLDEMEAKGCLPDIKTWTILLQGYCSAELVDEALSCFFKMLEKNVDPDGETLEVLIYGFLSKNMLMGAYKFLVEMVNKGLTKPWQATYKLMIEKLAEVGKVEEGIELLRMMRLHQYPPYADPLLEYISKNGTVKDAKDVLMAIPEKGAPSTSAYVRVIKSFFDQGRESVARDLIYSSPYRVRSQKEIRDLIGSGPDKEAVV